MSRTRNGNISRLHVGMVSSRLRTRGQTHCKHPQIVCCGPECGSLWHVQPVDPTEYQNEWLGDVINIY